MDTLKEIRKEIGSKKPLGLIIGSDNLITLDKWYKWKELLQWCHLIILARYLHQPNIISKILKQWIKTHIIKNYILLKERPFGHIFFSNTPYINISSTYIRTSLKNNFSCLNLLPISVINYIKTHKLYI
ncbi:MAG: hypothetical protein U0T59_02025 [Buchnera aphidicola (Meitanaphis flavogallis)]